MAQRALEGHDEPTTVKLKDDSVDTMNRKWKKRCTQDQGGWVGTMTHFLGKFSFFVFFLNIHI